MYVLSNWSIVNVTTPSGAVVMRLFGEVFDHPRYKAGEEITISALASYRIEDDALSVVTRSGSEYVLGRPNPAEPEAMPRVFRYLQDLGKTANTSAAAGEKSDGTLEAVTTRVR